MLTFLAVYTVKLLKWFFAMHWAKPASRAPDKSWALLWSKVRPVIVPSRQSACIPVLVFRHLHHRRPRELNSKNGRSYKPLGFRSVNSPRHIQFTGVDKHVTLPCSTITI